MSHVIALSSANASLGRSPLWLPLGLDSSVSVLSDALGIHWVVERWSDCGGDLSIIVFSSRDPDVLPTFLLFQQDGETRLATVENDEWTTDGSFRSLRHAVDVLIARAAVASKTRSRRDKAFVPTPCGAKLANVGGPVRSSLRTNDGWRMPLSDARRLRRRLGAG